MTRLPATALAILATSLLAACGGGSGEPSAMNPDQAAAPISVCGDDGVGFLVRSSGAGLLPFGAHVLFELGSYVAIDPSCRFAMTGENGIVHGGTLTSAQADELSRFLALEEWEMLALEYSKSCASHVGPTSFRWGRRRLELQNCSLLPPPPDDFRHDLLELHQEIVSRLEPSSEPLDGPMRYVLVDNSEAYEGLSIVREFRDAPQWPLGDPRTVAVVETFDGLRPAVQVVAGDAATHLRAIRNAWAQEVIGTRYQLFAPVVGSDGRRYELYIRDVAVGFEVEGGLIVPWLAEGTLGVTAIASADASRIDFTVSCGESDVAFASGTLEDTGGQSERYWRAQIEGVPAGPCRVELSAIDENGSPLICRPWVEVGGTGTPTIRPGWIDNASFRCDP